MATTGHKRAGNSRSGIPEPRRPGQHYSLSPIKERRLRTLPLPFDLIVPDDVEPKDVGSKEVGSKEVGSKDAGSKDAGSKDAGSKDAGSKDVVRVVRTDGPGDPSYIGQLCEPVSDTSAQHPSAASAQQALIAQLSREVKRMEVAGRVKPDQLGRRSAIFSSGCSTMDNCLPGGGYESGTVIEYLQNSEGSGATTLALCAAREALAVTDRFCVVVDWRQQFYPPAAAALGLDLKRLVIVRPTTLADRLWAIDQSLRSPAIAAVIAEVEQLDDRSARRLQLAAESGGSLGLLVRRASQRHHPSWAEVQWLVRPVAQAALSSRSVAANPVAANPVAANPVVANPVQAHRQLQLELLRVRGGQSGSRIHIQVNSLSGRLEPSTAAAALARTLSRTDGTKRLADKKIG